MNCQNCNERLPLSAKTCFACGAPVTMTAPGVSPSMAAAMNPARLSTPAAALPALVRVSAGGTPLLDRPFSAARRVMTLEMGQRLRVHSGQMGFFGVETSDGRRGFVDQGAVKDAAEPSSPLRPEPVRTRFDQERTASWPGPVGRPVPAAEIVEARAEPTPLRTPQMDMPISDPPVKSELPFNIPMLDGERVRYRAVFLYNPEEDQELVITNRRLVLTGGTIGRLPRVLHLDEVEAVRLQDSGTGSTSGEGHLWITVTGVPGALHVGGVHMPHHVRNEILSAATEARSLPRTDAPTVVIRKRKSS